MPNHETFDKLLDGALERLEQADSAGAVAELRTALLGRKGTLTAALRSVGAADPAERKTLGAAGNRAKKRLEKALQEKADSLQTGPKATPVDISLPGRLPRLGHRHPITLVLDELEHIFTGLGFSISEGPEVEDDWHNFEALNLGPEHPGRDMWDTFYVAGSKDASGNHKLLPRTHTSPVQIRAMERDGVPIRVIAPGRVYRNEAEDATHSAIFYNVEGLMVDDQTTFTDLKGVLTAMVRQLLGEETKLRFRPSYFPFTEPSAEIDVSSPHVRGGEWLELAGAGMVHPNVIKNAGHDPATYRGFAFGLGADRIAMLKYGVQDLRPFYKPDIRLLEQF